MEFWHSAVVCLFVGGSCCVEGVDCWSVFGGGPSLGVGVRERGKGGLTRDVTWPGGGSFRVLRLLLFRLQCDASFIVVAKRPTLGREFFSPRHIFLYFYQRTLNGMSETGGYIPPSDSTSPENI